MWFFIRAMGVLAYLKEEIRSNFKLTISSSLGAKDLKS